jgi:hypothetical protein
LCQCFDILESFCILFALTSRTADHYPPIIFIRNYPGEHSIVEMLARDKLIPSIAFVRAPQSDFLLIFSKTLKRAVVN